MIFIRTMIWASKEDHEWWRPAAFRWPRRSRFNFDKILYGKPEKVSSADDDSGAATQARQNDQPITASNQDANEQRNGQGGIDQYPADFTNAEVALRCALVEYKFRARLITAVTFTNYASQIRLVKLDLDALKDNADWLAGERNTGRIGELAQSRISQLSTHREAGLEKPYQRSLIHNVFQDARVQQATYRKLCEHLGRQTELFNLFPWEKASQEAGSRLESEILQHILDKGGPVQPVTDIGHDRSGGKREYPNSRLKHKGSFADILRRSFSRVRKETSVEEGNMLSVKECTDPDASTSSTKDDPFLQQ